MEHLSPGAVAPDFTLSTADGEAFCLSRRAKERPLLLAFYKAACPTCQLTFPYIQKLYAAFDWGTTSGIWAISQDAPDETRTFAQTLGLEFPVLIDEHPYDVSSAYALHYVPTLYLVDVSGRVSMADFGFSKPALTEVAEVFSSRLSQPAPTLFPAGDRLPPRRPG